MPEEKKYSFKKGLIKGVISLLAISGGAVAIIGFADVEIWDLIVKYIKPIVQGLTVGGLITVGTNFVKFKLKKAK